MQSKGFQAFAWMGRNCDYKILGWGLGGMYCVSRKEQDGEEEGMCRLHAPVSGKSRTNNALIVRGKKCSLSESNRWRVTLDVAGRTRDSQNTFLTSQSFGHWPQAASCFVFLPPASLLTYLLSPTTQLELFHAFLAAQSVHGTGNCCLLLTQQHLKQQLPAVYENAAAGDSKQQLPAPSLHAAIKGLRQQLLPSICLHWPLGTPEVYLRYNTVQQHSG